MDSAFSTAKLFSAVPVLTHPVPGAAVSLAVDASDSHVSAVLQQRLHGSWSPLAFYSKKLSSAESKYSSVVPGSKNMVADALSRPSALPVFSAMPLDLSAKNFDFSTLPALQSKCPSVQSMLLPVSLCHHLFMALHGISHPGVRASRRLLSSRFVWPCLGKDVDLWTRLCLRCQQSKVQSHVKSVPSIQVPG